MKKVGEADIRTGAMAYVFWAILVALWWISSDPDSAPQQAALAGQALVLTCIPYTILSTLQRSQHEPARKRVEDASDRAQVGQQSSTERG